MFRCAVAILSLLIPAIVFAEDAFDLRKEFPNYFLPPAYRQVPVGEEHTIPYDVVDRAKGQVEKALTSIFLRLEVPIVPEGGTELQNVRFFEHMTNYLRKTDKDVEILPSSGVVRSALGYLYFEMAQGMKKVPPISPEDTLQRIIDGKEGIPGYRIRGVGSDFDLLLLTPNQEKIPALQAAATALTESAEARFNARDIEGGVKKSLFTVPDVKPYETQTNSASGQGGAALDWLAFRLNFKDGTGEFVQPRRAPLVVEDFLRGLYEYLPAEPGVEKESNHKQTVRGFRSLIELPFLRISDESELAKEIEALTKFVKSGGKIEAKAMEQFDKMVRNARMSGGHNRLLRGGPGSIEKQLESLLAALRAQSERPPIPEYVDSFSLEGRESRAGDLPLMPVQQFLAEHTHKKSLPGGATEHILFHGTGSLDRALAILRGGLFISGGKQDQGTALYGRGVYTSPRRQVSYDYAGANGAVLELKVREDGRLNILDLNTHANHPAVLKARARAEREKRDFHEVLAREYDIDVILNEHVLLQNIEAVHIPEDLHDILRAVHSVLENPHASLATRLNAWVDYASLQPYAEAGGDTRLPPVRPLRAFMRELIQPNEAGAKQFLSLLAEEKLSTVLREEYKGESEFRAPVLALTQKRIRDLHSGRLQPKTVGKRLGEALDALDRLMELEWDPGAGNRADDVIRKTLDASPDPRAVLKGIDLRSDASEREKFRLWTYEVLPREDGVLHLEDDQKKRKPDLFDELLAKLQAVENPPLTKADKALFELATTHNFYFAAAALRGSANAKAMVRDILREGGPIAERLLEQVTYAKVERPRFQRRAVSPALVDRLEEELRSTATDLLADPQVRAMALRGLFALRDRESNWESHVSGTLRALGVVPSVDIPIAREALAHYPQMPFVVANEFNRWSERLLRTDPETYSRLLPVRGIFVPYGYRIRRDAAGGLSVSFSREETRDAAHGPLLSLLAKMKHVDPAPLTEVEKTLLLEMVHTGTWNRRVAESAEWIVMALTGTAETKAIAWGKIREMGTVGTRWLAEALYETPHADLQEKTAKFRRDLERVLNEDPSLRAAVLDEFLYGAPRESLGQFPFDLHNPVDRARLKDAFRGPEQKRLWLEDTYRRVQKDDKIELRRGQTPPKWQIAETSHRDRIHNAVIAEKLATSPELAQRIEALDPVFHAENGGVPSPLEVRFGIGEVHYRGNKFVYADMFRLWNERGRDALPAEFQELLRHWEKPAHPLLSFHAWASRDSGAPREWVMQRLRASQRPEEVFEFLDLFDPGDPDTARVKPKLRELYRAYFDRGLGADVLRRSERSGRDGSFPFEWRDPADVRLLKALARQFPRHSGAIQSEWDRESELLPTADQFKSKTLEEAEQDDFLTIRDARKFRKAKAELLARHLLEPLFAAAFEADPLRFAGEIGDGDFEVPWVESVMAKLLAKRRFTDAEKNLIGYFTHHPDNWGRLLANPAIREIMMKKLSAMTSPPWPEILEALHSDDTVTHERFRRLVTENPALREHLVTEMIRRPHLLSQFPVHLFPWDLSQPREADFLKSLFDGRYDSDSVDRMLKLLAVLEETGGSFVRESLPEGAADYLRSLSRLRSQIKNPEDRIPFSEAKKRLEKELAKSGSRIKLKVEGLRDHGARGILGKSEGKTLVTRVGEKTRVTVFLDVDPSGRVSREAFREELGHVRQYRKHPERAAAKTATQLESEVKGLCPRVLRARP